MKILKFCKKFFLSHDFWINIIIAPIVTGLAVSFLWQVFNNINPKKIHLYLPYAYEYGYLGATNTYKNQGREVVAHVPIEMKLDEKGRGLLRLGLYNANIKSLKKVKVHLCFPEGITVVDNKGWIPWEINREYYSVLSRDINNGLIDSFEPIMIELRSQEQYRISYSISGEDIAFISRNFLIKATK